VLYRLFFFFFYKDLCVLLLQQYAIKLMLFSSFQELDLTASTLVLDNSKRGETWEPFILSALQTLGRYQEVQS
jgi:hypothetical protein